MAKWSRSRKAAFKKAIKSHSQYRQYRQRFISKNNRLLDQGKDVYSLDPLSYEAWRNKETRLYRDYLEKQYTRTNTLLSQGHTPDNAIPLTKTEWESVYLRYKNTYEEEKEKGKINSIPNINDTIISDDLYKFSRAQADTMLEAMINYGGFDLETKNINALITSLRTGELQQTEEWFDMIRAMNDELRADSSISKEERRRRIAQTFYGSP